MRKSAADLIFSASIISRGLSGYQYIFLSSPVAMTGITFSSAFLPTDTASIPAVDTASITAYLSSAEIASTLFTIISSSFSPFMTTR